MCSIEKVREKNRGEKGVPALRPHGASTRGEHGTRVWAAVGTQATVFCAPTRSKAQEWGMKMSSDLMLIFPTTERILSLRGVHDDSSLPTRSQQTTVRFYQSSARGTLRFWDLQSMGKRLPVEVWEAPRQLPWKVFPQYG